jgi:serine/threonine protein kinase/DNA-binding winged helix-turn-helix (wHTH) protein/Flp pilus assembly protein TadD
MKDTLKARVRFGIFELDLKAGELREGGRKVVLQEQSLRVLRILIDHEGEIASREEIQKKLWPNDTIVEFDRGINAVINKLRKLLGDSAEEPRYIETVARRGYRLMMPVKWVDSNADNAPPSPDIEEGVVGLPGLEPSTLIGKTVTHYRVLGIIGGGMGVVYSAEDLRLPRSVALKFLPEELGNDPRALERFELEARAASVLEHSNICPIYEFGEHAGRPFIVMQLLTGQTLRDRMAAQAEDGSQPQNPPFAVDELLDIAIQIACGLEAAHEKGVVHRDIKPANIFLTDRGVVKILDFGLAKLLRHSGEKALAIDAAPTTAADVDLAKPRGAHLTRLGVAVGTEGYMSPEQVRGEPVDARADLFSFGVVLYEMATGQRPFSGETAAILRLAIAQQVPVPPHELNATLPPELEPIINKALEKDRELRYQSAAAMRANLEEVKRGQESLTPVPSPLPLPKPGRWKLWQLAATAVLAASLVGGGLYWRSRKATALTAQDTIVLADFANSTSDPAFDDALNTALPVGLQQTPFLNLLAPDKVRRTLKLMNQAEEGRFTPALAREVCLRTNSKALIAGSISDVGNRYRIELKAADCQTGKTLAAIQTETASRDEVIRVLGIASADLRRKLGEPRASLAKFNKPLDEATSSSVEALQALAEGARQKRLHGDVPATFSYFTHAVQLDPNFAQPYLNLGIGYLNTHQVDLSVQNLRKAYELRDRVTERARFAIEAFYYIQVTGQADKSIQILTEWTKTYPADSGAHGNLSADLMSVGQYEKAAAEARESVRLRPTAFAYVNLMTSYLRLNRMDEAKVVFDEARGHNLNDGLLYDQRYLLAFLEGDKPGMEAQLAWAQGKPMVEDMLLSAQSNTEAYYGRFKKSRDLSQQAVDSARHAGILQTAAGWRLDEALREAEAGNTARAQQLAAEALALSTQRNVQASAALALARTGDLIQAAKLCQKLNQDYPLDTWMQDYTLPTVWAAIELQRNDPLKAIDTLRAAAPYELGDLEFQSFEALYPAYVRGDAYLKAGKGQLAAAEFQKMIGHSGIVGNSITGALAHLQLGRAQAMTGDKEAARKSYQDFLTLWKDADPDIPIYKQAKTEYAKLN